MFSSRTTGQISIKLGTKHPLVKGIQFCSNEGLQPFSRRIITKKRKYIDNILKSSPEPQGQFQPILTQSIFGLRKSSSNKRWDTPFFRDRQLRKSGNILTKFKTLLLQNHWANFNQTQHKAALGKGNSSFNHIKNHALFQGEIIKNAKIH